MNTVSGEKRKREGNEEGEKGGERKGREGYDFSLYTLGLTVVLFTL